MVRLSELFNTDLDVEIENIMVDSRRVMPNSIFFCIVGMMNDGHRFIEQAIKNGAVVIVHSNILEEVDPSVTYIKVKDVVQTLNQVADLFYGSPSSKMTTFGVTGTNGKSSITMMIRNILNEYVPTGYIGTISVEYGQKKLPPLLTTPDINDLQNVLNKMVQEGMKAVTLEVSSIGLEQHRVDMIDFDVAIFTNFTHDHLDYHGTLENYFLAKKKFFDNLKPDAVAITNIDDAMGLKIVEDCPCRILTYGIEHEADYMAKDIQLMKDKTLFTLRAEGAEVRVETNLVAMFNLYNLLAAIAALRQAGVSLERIVSHLNHLPQVAGRMERIDEGQPFNIIVDFAHTPDGLQQVFEYATRITPKGKRIIAVFGSAGKRDTKKRVIFGELADRYCDMIILTEDDPRDGSISEIANEIAKGIQNTNYIIIEKRYDAIRQAIEMANTQDTILILGKGDESFIYRDFGREPYLGDHRVAQDVLHKFYFGE